VADPAARRQYRHRRAGRGCVRLGRSQRPGHWNGTAWSIVASQEWAAGVNSSDQALVLSHG
jgi:hypothetical protein